MDPWLPIGLKLSDGGRIKSLLLSGDGWQIYELIDEGRSLVVTEEALKKWIALGLVAQGTFLPFGSGKDALWHLSSPVEQSLCPLQNARVPYSKADAMAFAIALRQSRSIDGNSNFHKSIYVERISRLLPTSEASETPTDESLLGEWLTGGIQIPITSIDKLRSVITWLGHEQLKDVIDAAGISFKEREQEKSTDKLQKGEGSASNSISQKTTEEFEIAGRPELTTFFREHIIDIVRKPDLYRSMGIRHPSSVILHGPPGCGKTYAVDQLIEFLEWPKFQIDASSIGSPYIHETSKKVAQVFGEAMDRSPSVLVIDEMEAFLADRTSGSGGHRVEEVAEFLRRVPEAISRGVLILAMTNRIDLIDSAIRRTGRFDHIIEVSYATEVEVRSLLDKLLSELPRAQDLELGMISQQLAGKPLSDVAFVVREGARLAARHGKMKIETEDLMAALRSVPRPKNTEGSFSIKLGFT